MDKEAPGGKWTRKLQVASGQGSSRWQVDKEAPGGKWTRKLQVASGQGSSRWQVDKEAIGLLDRCRNPNMSLKKGPVGIVLLKHSNQRFLGD